MKIIRDYLTSQELGYIVNAMLEKETALEREIVKVALVAQLLGEDIGEFEDCNDIYDMVMVDDKINFEAIVRNYDLIDKLVAEETSINKVLKEFVEDMSKKIEDAVKNLDLNSAVKELKKVTEEHQNVFTADAPKSRKKG